MKAVRVVRWLSVLGVLALGACGGGSIKSPDFESELQSIAVTPTTSSVALGQTVQFAAIGTFSTPPGQGNGANQDISSDVTWKATPTTAASIDENGLLTTLAQGTVTVTATRNGITSNAATVAVGAPILTSVVVYTVVDGQTTTASTASIALGTSQDFKVLGVYSNSTTPRELDTGTASVAWNAGNTAVATVSPATGVITTATSQAVGSTTIIAKVTDATQSKAFTGNATLTVTSASLSSLDHVSPATASVAIGKVQPFEAIGRYSDNTEAVIDDSQINWSSATETVATIDTAGDATGVAQGTTQITATLKDSVPISGTQRSASATLSVTNASCVNALLADNGATVTVAKNSDLLCLGCIVDDEANVIDNDSTNYGNMVAPVGLLGGNISLTVAAADGVSFPASATATRITGFVIGRPANQLLSAELLSQLQVSTLKAGEVQESSGTLNPLRLTLLGLLGDNAQSLLTFEATKDFDSVRLTFNAGVLTALSSTQVYSACSLAEVPEASP